MYTAYLKHERKLEKAGQPLGQSVFRALPLIFIAIPFAFTSHPYAIIVFRDGVDGLILLWIFGCQYFIAILVNNFVWTSLVGSVESVVEKVERDDKKLGVGLGLISFLVVLFKLSLIQFGFFEYVPMLLFGPTLLSLPFIYAHCIHEHMHPIQRSNYKILNFFIMGIFYLLAVAATLTPYAYQSWLKDTSMFVHFVNFTLPMWFSHYFGPIVVDFVIWVIEWRKGGERQW